MAKKLYDHHRIEKAWQAAWAKAGVFSAGTGKKKKQSYVLDMFPYPSGDGLHVGHPLGYIASDITARYQRMKGHDVLHPMGWDAFGLPAENAAIKKGIHPRIVTEQNIANFKRQLQMLGFSYDWSREINTTDPEYYKWTQWIFLQLYKQGLAYEAEAPIWWCPKDKTGLANEEVVNGKCDRCGSVVERKMLKQWMLKITAYAERLLSGLVDLEWPESIKTAQRNWIGKSEGAEIVFELRNEELKMKNCGVKVYTTRPDTIFGATYLVLAPDHELVDVITTGEQKKAVAKYQKSVLSKSDLERTSLDKEKTGVFTGAYAINPATKKKIPVWIADYVLKSYGTGAIMAVPGHDERDWAFAKKYGLPVVRVIDHPTPTPPALRATSPRAGEEVWTGEGIMQNSGEFDGMKSEEARIKIIDRLATGGRTSKPTCLVVHGISGHKKENWFPWFKKELEGKGWNAIIPTMPGTGHPTAKSWNDYLMHFDDSFTEDSVLVGHSLGCAAVLKHLETLNRSVGTVILVAPTSPLLHWDELKRDIPEIDWDAVVPMNQEKDFNWNKIGQLAKRIVIIYSDNDPYIPVESMSYFKKHLPAAEFRCIPGKFHFSETMGITELPEIFEYLPIVRESGSFARTTVKYKLRDWVFSRQRYWGEPIPLVHCEKDGVVPVPEKELPVLLPDIKKYEPTGTGESPLAGIESWVNTKCPKCGGPAKRETNTMPQWAGSCWYYLRFADPQNTKALASDKAMKSWLPVDTYIGGAEHAVLHLLYARFWHKVLFDAGCIPPEVGDEPFIKLKNQGLILGEDGEKMSKSRGNVINPDDIVEKFGADTLRMFEMFMGPFEDAKPWDTNGLVGVRRFLDKAYELREKVTSEGGANGLDALVSSITTGVEQFRFNTCVSDFMKQVNEWKSASEIPQADYETFLKLLSPFAPHLCEELWRDLGHKTLLATESWPSFDPEKVKRDIVTLVVQVNGKRRAALEVPAGSDQAAAEATARADENVMKFLTGTPKKVVFVKDRLVNFVV